MNNEMQLLLSEYYVRVKPYQHNFDDAVWGGIKAPVREKVVYQVGFSTYLLLAADFTSYDREIHVI